MSTPEPMDTIKRIEVLISDNMVERAEAGRFTTIHPGEKNPNAVLFIGSNGKVPELMTKEEARAMLVEIQRAMVKTAITLGVDGGAVFDVEPPAMEIAAIAKRHGITL